MSKDRVTEHSATENPTSSKSSATATSNSVQCDTPACRKRRFKWTRRLLTLSITLPILLFLAFAGAVKLMDFNQYKPQIEKEVGDLTQLEFVIQGDIHVSVLPFMFSVGEMQLKNPKGFEPENLLAIKEAQIELSLPDLFLNQELKIKSLELIEPQLTFIQRQQDNNWQNMPFLSQLNGNQAAKLMPAVLNSQSPAVVKVNQDANGDAKKFAQQMQSSAAAPWSLESLSVQNASIRYIDQAADFDIQLEQADLLAFDVLPNQPFRINSHFIYRHSQSPRTFEFEINTNLLLNQDYTQLHLSDWNGVFRLQLPHAENRPDIRLTTSGKNMMVDFKHQQIYVHQAKLKGLNAELQTSFQGEYGADPVYQGLFIAKSIDIPRWLDSFGLPLPEDMNADSLKQSSGKFKWYWDGQWLKLEQLELDLQTEQQTSKLSGDIVWPLAAAYGSSKTAQFDLHLQNFNSSALVNTADAKPTAQGMRVNAVDEKLFAALAGVLQMAIQRNALEDKLRGKLQLADVRLANVSIKQALMEFKVSGDQVLVAPMDFEFEQGRLASQFNFDVKHSSLSWQGMSEQLALQAFLPNAHSLDGLLDSRFYWQTEGQTPKQWQANLNGIWNNQLSQVKVYGLDINRLLSGEVFFNTDKNDYTEFSQVDIQGRWQQGVYSPKRLLAQSQRFSGSGYMDWSLPKQSVEGALNLTIEQPSQAMARLQGAQIKALFAGPVSNPQWSIDLAQLGQRLFGQ